MATEDIERLKEKIEKDPNSKLFVPLAEEYKKAGMFDEAVEVIIKGLERQPGYLSARVSLGKIYLERGQLEEAKSEFEKVIAAIPDNLYAHKKLAEIYKDLGDRERSAKEFRTVLKLNPMDEWAETSLAEIESGRFVQPKEQIAEVVEEASPRAESPLDEVAEAFEIPMTVKNTEFEKPLSEPIRTEEIGEVAVPEVSIEEEERELEPQAAEELEEEQAIEEKPAGISMSREDMELWKAHLEVVENAEETLQKPSSLSGRDEETELREHPASSTVEEQAEATTEADMETFEAETLEAVSFADMLKEPEAAEQVRSIPREPSRKSVSIEEADQLILHGRYFEAMDVYKALLSLEPDNQHILQRIHELKALLKLLGKDKEALIAQLDGFIDSIKKRRDEFFRSS